MSNIIHTSKKKERVYHPWAAVRHLVRALLGSVEPLLQAALLLVGFLFVYAIFAVTLFQSTLRGRCFYPLDGPNATSGLPAELQLDDPRVCGMDGQGRVCPVLSSGLKNASVIVASVCNKSNPTTGEFNPNPSQHKSFDNMAAALMMLFQIITTDGWSEILYLLHEGSSAGMATVFFVVFIFTGTMYFMNICLAIVTNCYSQNKDDSSGPFGSNAKQRVQRLKRKLNALTAMGTLRGDDQVEYFSKEECREFLEVAFYTQQVAITILTP